MIDKPPTLGEIYDVLIDVCDWLDGEGYPMMHTHGTSCICARCKLIRLRDRLEREIKPKGVNDANG